MADLLIQRTQHQNWVVVFKSLISIHNIMNYGNEVRTVFIVVGQEVLKRLHISHNVPPKKLSFRFRISLSDMTNYKSADF